MTPPAGIDHLALLATYQRAFLETLERADPATPVPSCGRWRVRNLVVHLARIHHWAAAQARQRPERPLGRGPFDLPRLYADCAAELLQTLTDLDPDARAWTLLDDGVPAAQQHGTVRFWHRRQALETMVHLWDLRTALGEQFDPGADAWADCLEEVVSVMHPRQIRLGRVPAPKVRLRLQPTDAVGHLDVAAAADARATAAVTGPASRLALLAWGRTGLDDAELQVDGDHAALERVLATGLTP